MTISINQTSPTLSVIDRLNKEKEEQEEKLASGKRINSAADDAAGLQISDRLTSQINGYQQLSYNSQDQININDVQSAQLGSIGESLQRANVLSIQSGSPLSDADAIQGELDELTEQINTIAGEVLGDDEFISGLDASDPEATQEIIAEAYATISENAAALGAESNALGSQVSTYETTTVNVSAARSRIQDTDYAATSGEQSQNQVLIQSAIINKRDEEERKGLLINQVV